VASRFDQVGVTTGKPGIHLALSRFGFSQTPLPAQCRQATLCAWRSRQRKIPDRRSAEVTAGGHLRATSGADTFISRSRSSIFGKPWWPRLPNGCPRRPKEPNADARQTLRTVWLGRDVCATHGNSMYSLIEPCIHTMSGALRWPARAKRYARWGLGGACAKPYSSLPSLRDHGMCWRPCLPPEVQLSPAQTRAKRYAHLGLGDTCAPNPINQCMIYNSNV